MGRRELGDGGAVRLDLKPAVAEKAPVAVEDGDLVLLQEVGDTPIEALCHGP